MPKIDIQIPEEYLFETEITVRKMDIWGDLHVGSHTMFELVMECYFRFWDHCGFTPLDIFGSGLVFSNFSMIFQSEVHYGDILKTQVSVGNFSDYGCDMFFRMLGREDGREIAQARIYIVFFDFKNKKKEAVGRAVQYLSENMPRMKNINFQNENQPTEEENKLYRKVMSVAEEVHRFMPANTPESVYRKLFCYELNKVGIGYEVRKKETNTRYKELNVKGIRTEIIIEKQIMVEIKYVEQLNKPIKSKFKSYMKSAGLRLGLLINFNVADLPDGIARIVL